MSTTTALDLLEHADLLTRQLRRSDTPTTAAQWESFDVTLHRLLLELIGADAAHVRTADPGWRAMQLAIHTYPTPLRPPVGTRMMIAQAAHYQGRPRDAVRDDIRYGRLRAVKDDDCHWVDSRDLDTRPDIRPADPTDPHPIARIACTLGAMADLVQEARTTGPDVLRGNGETAGAALHVLSMAAVAARHTLAHGTMQDAERPLLVGRYAERVIDTLRDVALQPASLHRLAGTIPVAEPVTLNERLEAALHNWGVLARDEIRRPVPSVDVLRQVANQGAHLCDIRAQLETSPISPRIKDLRQTGQALRRGEQAWERLTTLTRPSHDFVTASRELFTTLRQVGMSVAAGDGALDRTQAANDLDHGLAAVGQLMTLTQSLPERLTATGVLRGPAKSLRSADDRLNQRAHGRYVTVRHADVPELGSVWLKACTGIDRGLGRPTVEAGIQLGL